MKSLIPSRVLNQVQTLLEGEMNTACTIYAPGTKTADGMGGYTNGTPSTVASTVCFIGELGSSTQEREIANQNTEDVLFTFRMPHDTNINKNYWIVSGGLTYEILGYMDSDIDAYKKVIVRLKR